MKDTAMTLDRLRVGDSCIINQVGNSRGAVKRRLIDMGLTPGTRVKLVKMAPFGDPMEVQLRGYELSQRLPPGQRLPRRVRPLLHGLRQPQGSGGHAPGPPA